MQHNLLIKPRESDWIFGSTSKVVFKAVTNGIWPVWFNEDQRNPDFDTDGCACYGANRSCDMQLDLLLQSNGALLSELIAMGFFQTGLDGKSHFRSSPRFTENLTGNGTNGNSIPECFDVIRKYGLIPFSAMPFDQTMTQAEYFTAPTAEQLALGKQFLSLVGGSGFCQYHWINNDAPKNVSLLQSQILQAPLTFGIAVDDAGWNQPTPIDPPASQAPQHVVTGYEIVAPSADVADNYAPYLKVLDAGYPINFTLQAVVTLPIVQEQEIVSQISDVVSEIPAQPVAEQPTLLQEVEEVVKEIESIL